MTLSKLAAEAAYTSGKMFALTHLHFLRFDKTVNAVLCQALNILYNLIRCVSCLFPGGEQASITLRANIQVVQSQVEVARKLSADADKKLAETKVDEIQRMAEYAASLENSEDIEVHEAYLRED